MRLSGKPAFERVYAAKARHSDGPLLFYSVPNDGPRARLGLAVARRVGTAVVRNRIKRLLREAFRHAQHEWPPRPRYDVVISVRPHVPLALPEYQRLLATAIEAIHATWTKKLNKKSRPPQTE